MRATRVLGALGLVGGALAAWEVAAVARVVRHEDGGGRADHADTLGEGVGEPLGLVLLGDSAVDGHGLTAPESLPRQLAARVSVATGRRVRVRSLAVSGARTADVVTGQLPLLRAAGRVDAVLVGVGVNDVLRRTGTGALVEATTAMAGGLRAIVPDAALAVVVCHDLSSAPGLGPLLRRVVGARCRVVARHQRRVLAAADVPIVPVEGPGDPSMYGRDGLHPGADGVAAIAERAAAALVADDAAAVAGPVSPGRRRSR